MFPSLTRVVGLVDVNTLLLAQVAAWLNADTYSTDDRPVQLTELIMVNNRLESPSGQLYRDLGPSSPRDNPDHIVTLCAETVAEGAQVRGPFIFLCCARCLHRWNTMTPHLSARAWPHIVCTFVSILRVCVFMCVFMCLFMCLGVLSMAR